MFQERAAPTTVWKKVVGSYIIRVDTPIHIKEISQQVIVAGIEDMHTPCLTKHQMAMLHYPQRKRKDHSAI